MHKLLKDKVRTAYATHETDEKYMSIITKHVLVDHIDRLWPDCMYTMELIKKTIGFRGFAQVDPAIEYKKAGYEVFSEMMDDLKEQVTEKIFRLQLSDEAKEMLAGENRGG